MKTRVTTVLFILVVALLLMATPAAAADAEPQDAFVIQITEDDYTNAAQRFWQVPRLNFEEIKITIVDSSFVIETNQGNVTVTPPRDPARFYEGWPTSVQGEISERAAQHLADLLQQTDARLTDIAVYDRLGNHEIQDLRLVSFSLGGGTMIKDLEAEDRLGVTEPNAAVTTNVRVDAERWAIILGPLIGSFEEITITYSDRDVTVEAGYTATDDLWKFQITMAPTLRGTSLEWIIIESIVTDEAGEAIEDSREVRRAGRALVNAVTTAFAETVHLTVYGEGNTGGRDLLDHVGAVNFRDGQLVLMLLGTEVVGPEGIDPNLLTTEDGSTRRVVTERQVNQALNAYAARNENIIAILVALNEGEVVLEVELRYYDAASPYLIITMEPVFDPDAANPLTWNVTSLTAQIDGERVEPEQEWVRPIVNGWTIINAWPARGFELTEFTVIEGALVYTYHGSEEGLDE